MPLLIFLSILFHFPLDQGTGSNCNAPSNLNLVTKNDSSVTFNWEANTNAKEYNVWYYKLGELSTSPTFTAKENEYTFQRLESGSYYFYFQCVCNGGGSSNPSNTTKVVRL